MLDWNFRGGKLVLNGVIEWWARYFPDIDTVFWVDMRPLVEP